MASTTSSPSWYRGFIQGKTRITLAWAFSILLVLSARQAPQLPGIILCFVGATLRFWASGHLRKDKHPAIGGPYALTRNPLYLGTFLMALGIVWSIENWFLLAALAIFYPAIYHYIILDEEAKLKQMFGAPYRTYAREVPRLFPRLWPVSEKVRLKVNPEKSHHYFSWKLAKKNKALEAYYSFGALVGFVYFIAEIWLWIT